jgi:glycosyltransferase involved in cell wall biosynthesis
VRVALIVPGGVDPSGEYRVIPALLALIRRLAGRHDLQVFALRQGTQPGHWRLLGAEVRNIGEPRTRVRAMRALYGAHRAQAFDVIHAIWSGAPGLVAVAAGRLLGVPALVHVAGGELVALPAIGYGGRQSLKGRVREAMVLRAAQRVTAASGPMLQMLDALGIRATRVPLGVDLETWPPRPPLRRAAGTVARLVHVASLNRVKDQPTLLRALERLRAAGMEFRMQIAGEDLLEGEIQGLASRLGLAAALRFHGFVPQRALRALVADSDLMVMSSRHEAGPLSLHEAAVLGVPTVGTAVGQIADWAPQAALAAPVGDPDTLARHMLALLTDEELRLRIAYAAHAAALRENADSTVRAFETLYEEVAGRAGR